MKTHMHLYAEHAVLNRIDSRHTQATACRHDVLHQLMFISSGSHECSYSIVQLRLKIDTTQALGRTWHTRAALSCTFTVKQQSLIFSSAVQ